MKKLALYVLAGMVGGLITLGGSQLLPSSNQTQAELQPAPITQPNYGQLATQQTFRTANLPTNFTNAAEKAMPAVVHITAIQNKRTASDSKRNNPFKDFFGDDFDLFFGNPYDDMPRQGTGSGVIIQNNGYIVTNNHVIDGADEYEVSLYDNRKFKATLVGNDPSTDLAVLKIEATDLPTVSYANSDDVRVGEWVLAVGNPFNLTSTVTAGIVSAKGRDINIMKDIAAIESFIQTDAAVNPGNSGGALIDTEGNLIGINTAIASRTGSFAGYSFAIPINIAKKVVEDLIEHGEVQRGFLGISIRDMDSDIANDLGLTINKGVHVVNVVEGGAADEGGLLKNDIIVGVNGREVNSSPELQEMIGRNRPGDTVRLTVNREGKEKDLQVELKGGS